MGKAARERCRQSSAGFIEPGALVAGVVLALVAAATLWASQRFEIGWLRFLALALFVLAVFLFAFDVIQQFRLRRGSKGRG